MLKLTGTAPIEISVGDATVTLAAPSPRIVAAGRRASRQAMDDDADLDWQIATVAFSEGVLAAAIIGWEGIGTADGEALDCTRDNIALALQDTLFFDALDREYVLPIYEREREKNASAVSSAGISAGATAGKTTADSAAATKRAAKPKAAKSTTKRSTKSSPKKADAKPSKAEKAEK